MMVMGVWTRQTWLYPPSSWWLYSLNIEPLSYKTRLLMFKYFVCRLYAVISRMFFFTQTLQRLEP